MKYSVASITVAYRGKTSLARQLRRLMDQSRQLDEIVVVDNASNDGTLEMLRQQFPGVTVLLQDQNLGVGGGASVGLAYAVKRGHDWMWWLDQDSIPAPDAVQELLAAVPRVRAAGHNPGLLASATVDEQSGHEYTGLVWRDHFVQAPEGRRQNDWYCADSVMSSGSLVAREVIERLGLPRTDYFIDYVDHEFNLRLRRNRYAVVVVRRSLLYHAPGEPQVLRVAGIARVWSRQPAWRHYYMARNETATVWHQLGTFRARMLLIGRLTKRAGAIVLLDSNKAVKLRRLVSGFLDGIRCRLGIRFLPETTLTNQPAVHTK